jgi:SOS-response transcriptional repressor LexA
MDRKGWSHAQLAKAGECGESTIRRATQENPKIPRLIQVDTIHAIKRKARLQGPDEWENTQEGVGEVEGRNIVPNAHAPLISWSQAGDFMKTGDASILADCETIVPVPHNRDSVFALRLRCDVINAWAGSGSLIIVDYDDRTLLSGQYYVVRHDGKLMARRFRRDPDRLEAHSHNPSYQPIFIDEPPEVVGRIAYAINPAPPKG